MRKIFPEQKRLRPENLANQARRVYKEGWFKNDMKGCRPKNRGLGPVPGDRGVVGAGVEGLVIIGARRLMVGIRGRGVNYSRG